MRILLYQTNWAVLYDCKISHCLQTTLPPGSVCLNMLTVSLNSVCLICGHVNCSHTRLFSTVAHNCLLLHGMHWTDIILCMEPQACIVHTSFFLQTHHFRMFDTCWICFKCWAYSCFHLQHNSCTYIPDLKMQKTEWVWECPHVHLTPRDGGNRSALDIPPEKCGLDNELICLNTRTILLVIWRLIIARCQLKKNN